MDGGFCKNPFAQDKSFPDFSSPHTTGIPEKGEALSKYRCYKGKTLVGGVGGGGGSVETEYFNWQEYQMHDGYFK